MNIGRLLGIGLLVLLLAGCQWLSPEDEERVPTEAAEPTLTTTPIPMPGSTPTVKLAPTEVPTPSPTPTPGLPVPTERPASPPPTDSADTQAMPIPERPFQDNFWSNASVQEARDTLERGTDIHALDADGLASLHIVAAVNPDSAVMRRRLDQGADIMTLDARGRMPLHWAAGFNSLEMVGLLIDSGSEVHGLDERGETPLHWAAANNPDPRVADLLLDNWAQLDAESQHGRTPLSMAVISNRQAAVVEFLLDQGAGTVVEDESGFTLLHLAAHSGAPDVVRLLLERGFDPNASHDEGSGPPLLQAAMGGDPLVVKALLEYGADVRLRSHPGVNYDMVLTNPPFGRKSSLTFVNSEGESERESLTVERPDFWATTSNKHLNFLQHVRTLLKTKGRAAIVAPDNVLFEGGAGETIRRKLLAECDAHTLLRLPTGIFYAQGVKANVLFFDRKPAGEEYWTRDVWIYDLRTHHHFTLKTNPLTRSDLDDFVSCYRAEDWGQREETERFRRFSYDDLVKRDKANLDIFWLRDESMEDSASLPPPDVIAEEILEDLRAALEQMEEIAGDLEAEHA